MQDIIDEIARGSGIDDAKATMVAGLILGFIRKEVPAATANKLFAVIPDADAIIAKASTTANSGGLIGGLGAMLGGTTGDAVALVSQLLATGVTLPQLESAGQVMVAELRSKAGPQVMSEILKSVPALNKIAPGV